MFTSRVRRCLHFFSNSNIIPKTKEPHFCIISRNLTFDCAEQNPLEFIDRNQHSSDCYLQRRCLRISPSPKSGLFEARKKMDRKPRKFLFDICQGQAGGDLGFASQVPQANGVFEFSELKPGMYVLKNWLSPAEQVMIVNTCRKLGLGKGGFYQPAFGQGFRRRKMHLKMMCLGYDWDPERKSYGIVRRYDNESPPSLPAHFVDLSNRAISAASGNFQMKDSADSVLCLPSMLPDVCIVNFYDAEFGRLGMHQDTDESKESIDKGLPVVSFSVGDTAEFVYGGNRDVEVAEKVRLESGDVVIFGGPSRLIFHGVSRVFASTAPQWLLKATGLRSGRLNLTFRKI